MPNFLFTGTFCSLNRGDAAMELSAGRALRTLIPKAQITIHTPYPEIDGDAYPCFRVFPSSRRKAGNAILLLIRVMLWRFLKRAGIPPPTALLAHRELQEYQQADVIVDLSGDTITDEYGPRCLISHLIPVLLAIFLHRPIVLCAQTIGPFTNFGWLAKRVLNRVNLITVREDLSLKALQDMGVKKPEVVLTADMAFLLEPASPPRIDEILASEGISHTDGLLIGMTLSRLSGHRYQSAVTHHFEVMMASVADYLIGKIGATVVFLSHVLGPGEQRDDRVIARRISSLVTQQGGVRMIRGEYRPEELKGIIGRFQMSMGLRMHANIAALSMGVPTLALAYSQKTYGIMSMVGQEKFVCDVSNLRIEDVTRKIDVLWEERDKVRKTLFTRIDGIRDKARENAHLIKQLMDAQLERDNLSKDNS